MRLLITGGTGFIGARLAGLARGCGHEIRVTGLVNSPAAAARRQSLEAVGIEVALQALDQPLPPELTRDIDAVVHLAAAQHEMNVPDEHFREINLRATKRLFEAAREAGVGRFVHGSTIGVYGERGGEIDAATPVGPDNIYGRTKLEAERWLTAQQDGPSVVVIRIGETYGPGDRRLLKLFRGIAAGRFPLLGRGQNLHHPIYVDDLCRGLLAAAERPLRGGEVFVLAGPAPVTTNEMVSAVAAAVDRPPPRLRLPLGPFLAAATVLERALRPLGVQPPLHRRRMDFFIKSLSFSLDGARHGLGFEPAVPFAEGARLTAGWYREQELL